MIAANRRKRCVFYLRVSTGLQVQGYSLAAQKTQLEQFAKQRNFILADIYRDAGLSGKHTHRPELQRLIKDAEAGQFDVVMVWAIDRISRNLVDLLDLVKRLRNCGVEFISISQDFDTTEPTGMLILHLLGSFAQFERELLVERVKESHMQRLQKSNWSCGPAPFGYRKENKGLIEVESEVKVVKHIFERYLQLKSIRGVTNELNSQSTLTRKGTVWFTNTVKGILKNPIYTGANVYGRYERGDTRLKSQSNWAIVPEMRAPIVELNAFNRVQETLGGQAGNSLKVDKQEYPISGKIYCPECGSKMFGKTRTSRGKVFRYYRCNGSTHRGKAFCSGKSWPADEMEKQYEGCIETVKPEHSVATKEPEQVNTVDGVNSKIHRLFELYENQAISKKEFTERLAILGLSKIPDTAE